MACRQNMVRSSRDHTKSSSALTARHIDLSPPPPNSKIHGVISIDHLEPYELDPFGRSLPYAGPVRAERHERKIVAKRETRGQRKQYLIEYLGLGQEFREWKSATQVGADAADMIDDFRRRQPPLRKDGGYGVAVTW